MSQRGQIWWVGRLGNDYHFISGLFFLTASRKCLNVSRWRNITSRKKFVVENALPVKENREHNLDIGFCLASLHRLRRMGSLPLSWLDLCFHIVLIYPCFICSNNGFQEVSIIICHFKKFFAATRLMCRNRQIRKSLFSKITVSPLQSILSTIWWNNCAWEEPLYTELPTTFLSNVPFALYSISPGTFWSQLVITKVSEKWVFCLNIFAKSNFHLFYRVSINISKKSSVP